MCILGLKIILELCTVCTVCQITVFSPFSSSYLGGTKLVLTTSQAYGLVAPKNILPFFFSPSLNSITQKGKNIGEREHLDRVFIASIRVYDFFKFQLNIFVLPYINCYIQYMYSTSKISCYQSQVNFERVVLINFSFLFVLVSFGMNLPNVCQGMETTQQGKHKEILLIF